MGHVLEEAKHYRMDRRARRTRNSLTTALVKLMAEKELYEISITELTQIAGINRATFYLHYSDVFALFHQIEDDLFTAYMNHVSPFFDGEADFFEQIDPADDSRKSLPILRETLSFIADHSEYVNIILKDNHSHFLVRVYELGKQPFITSIRKMTGREPTELEMYISHFIVGGCIGIIREWLGKGMRENIREIELMIVGFINKGYGILTPSQK